MVGNAQREAAHRFAISIKHFNVCVFAQRTDFQMHLLAVKDISLFAEHLFNFVAYFLLLFFVEFFAGRKRFVVQNDAIFALILLHLIRQLHFTGNVIETARFIVFFYDIAIFVDPHLFELDFQLRKRGTVT